MYLKWLLKTEKRFTLFASSEEWEMMIEGCFSNVLRNMPRMKFQREIFEERTQDANKNTYAVKRIDKSDIERSSEFTEEYYKGYWGSKETF